MVIGLLYGFAAHRNAVREKGPLKVEFANKEALFISHETVNKLLIQIQNPSDIQEKENINLTLVEEFLQSHEMVENAEIFRALNGELGAIITQRTPVLRVSTATETFYYDKFGQKMPLSENYSARVPITTDTLQGSESMDLITLANRVLSDEVLHHQVIGIDQEDSKGVKEFVLITRQKDQEIVLGSMDQLEAKIAKLKVFYRKTQADSSLAKYKSINLKFHNQIVCEKY